MKNLYPIGYLFVSILMVCCASHNVPSGTTPNVFIQPNVIKAFVDLNGNFYPDNWQQTIGPYERTSSLYLTAKKNNVLNVLEDFETKKLEEFKKILKDKKRVFIFIHGFNKPEEKSKISYNNLMTKININPKTDEVIEFYWDGLTSNDPLGSGKIWFNATGYSQMAGEFGLRKILNIIYNKDIILISHSRGASVVLSALSNPPFDPDFYKKTKNLGIPISNPNPLQENDNRIISIMLAPAIGEIDFAEETDTNKYRKFSSQLKSIDITINNNDPVLNKFVGFSGYFNPTNLGYELSVYKKLHPAYNFITYKDFTGQKSHDFNKYVENPLFLEILKKYL